jgi:ABC-type glycerol-3-phosphate transport system substrate-binding protein
MISNGVKRKLFILSLIVVFSVVTGCGCKISGEAKKFPPVNLEYWGVNETPEDIRLLTNAYTSRHPKITITYRTFREDEYKQKLLEAWAQGQGPDLFMVPNTKIREYLKFITPMPASMKAPVQTQTGTIKKETLDKVQTYTGLKPTDIRKNFLDVVSDDVVIDGKIWALPYSVDTLSVYYNREMLKNANIALPAQNWEELISQSPAITKIDSDDKIVQSAIAMGATNNVPAALEIILSLMLQVGVNIGDTSGPLFHTNPESLKAVDFFLNFSRKGLSNYSWDKTLPNALDVFTSGKLAYFIGYPYHAALIRQINPQLDFEVIPMFQLAGAENPPSYASYNVTLVTKPRKGEPTQKSELAWQYLLESTDKNNVKPFLSNPTHPRTTALRALVDVQKTDLFLGPFAQNLLKSRSWYHGYNYDLAKKYFLEMIDNMNAADPTSADKNAVQYLGAGSDLIRQTYRQTE